MKAYLQNHAFLCYNFLSIYVYIFTIVWSVSNINLFNFPCVCTDFYQTSSFYSTNITYNRKKLRSIPSMDTWGRYTTNFCFQCPMIPCGSSLYNQPGSTVFFIVWMFCVSFERVCECLESAWVSESVVSVCVSEILFKNLHTDLIWSGLSSALLSPEMIGKPLASLHGDVRMISTSRASTL